MNEVLGTTAGNALEIGESIRYLRNEARDARLDEVTLSLCAEMLRRRRTRNGPRYGAGTL